MQKKGKDRKNLLSTTPLLFLCLLLGSSVIWFVNRDTQVTSLTYGELMQILQADDPGVHFQKVVVKRNSDIRGEMVSTDAVSDGKATPGKIEEALRLSHPHWPG